MCTYAYTCEAFSGEAQLACFYLSFSSSRRQALELPSLEGGDAAKVKPLATAMTFDDAGAWLYVADTRGRVLR